MEKKRWLFAVIGVITLLFSGVVYAWSVLSSPIAAEFSSWTKAQLSLTFTIVMILFCIGCVAGGALAAKVPARIYLWISAGLFLLGFLLTANITSLVMLYISFGVICGFASGLSYNAVMGTVGKWFPDKQGLISGILLTGFAQLLHTSATDSFSVSMFGTVLLQTLWAMPFAPLAYLPAARWMN